MLRSTIWRRPSRRTPYPSALLSLALAATAMCGTPAARADSVFDPFFIDAPLEAKSPDPRGGKRSVTVPPCTPLQLPVLDDGKTKRTEVSYGPWIDLTIQRKPLDAARRFDDFATCIKSAEAYAGRFQDEHVQMAFERELAVGMPMEFAWIVLGPEGQQADATEAEDLTWSFRSGMMESCEPLRPQSVESVSLPEIEAGRIRIVAAPDNRSIESIRLTLRPRVASPERQAFKRGIRLQNSGDEPGALGVWLPLAEQGYPPAQYEVAELRRRGEGVEPDPAQARALYEQAAHAGHAPAMVRLAYLVSREPGGDVGGKAAWRWMTAAKALGNEDAAEGLRRLAIGQSPERVAEFRRAAEGWFTPPEPLEQPLPAKPEIPAKLHFVGNVILEAIVRADGSVSDIRVQDVIGARMCFEGAAVDAVSRWRYRPATRDGAAIDLFSTIVVEFR